LYESDSRFEIHIKTGFMQFIWGYIRNWFMKKPVKNEEENFFLID